MEVEIPTVVEKALRREAFSQSVSEPIPTREMIKYDGTANDKVVLNRIENCGCRSEVVSVNKRQNNF